LKVRILLYKTFYIINSEKEIFHKWLSLASYDYDVLENDIKVLSGDNKKLIDKPPSWERTINRGKDSAISVFIILPDSVEKYGWYEVLSKNIYTKKYKYKYEDIKKMKWKITISDL
jgi:hypothetical protein